MKIRALIKGMVIFSGALILSGCVCQHTHVPGRRVDHGSEPDSMDAFFCVLDYWLFTPDGDLRSNDTRDEQIRREQREYQNQRSR